MGELDNAVKSAYTFLVKNPTDKDTLDGIAFYMEQKGYKDEMLVDALRRPYEVCVKILLYFGMYSNLSKFIPFLGQYLAIINFYQLVLLTPDIWRRSSVYSCKGADST